MLFVFFWLIVRRLNFICHLHRQVGVHLPAYDDGTECSETSAYKVQTPGDKPEEGIQHLEHGESLKSRIHKRLLSRDCFFLLPYVRFPKHIVLVQCSK